MQLIESKKKPRFVNPYIRRMDVQGDWVFEENAAKNKKGCWLPANSPTPLHVEIGTGNGAHFASYAQKHPDIFLLGFEIKFKTLVQSIERARDLGASHCRMIKGDARCLTDYFSENEVEKIMIHFPDPWPKRRQQKNRLLQAEFYQQVERVLKVGGSLEFKTDHYEYFQFATREVAKSSLVLSHFTEDLHHSFRSTDNFITGFESLFLKKGQPIYSFCLRKI